MNRRGFLGLLSAVIAVPFVGRIGGQEPEIETAHVVKVKMIEDGSAIYSIDPRDTPMLAMIGRGAKFQVREWPSHKIEWLEDIVT